MKMPSETKMATKRTSHSISKTPRGASFSFTVKMPDDYDADKTHIFDFQICEFVTHMDLHFIQMPDLEGTEIQLVKGIFCCCVVLLIRNWVHYDGSGYRERPNVSCLVWNQRL